MAALSLQDVAKNPPCYCRHTACDPTQSLQSDCNSSGSRYFIISMDGSSKGPYSDVRSLKMFQNIELSCKSAGKNMS